MAVFTGYEKDSSEHLGRPIIEGTCEAVEPSDEDMLMIGLDVSGVSPQEQSRYRDCLGCHQSFRHRNETDWRCAVCRGKESRRQHEQERGEALNVANGKFK